MNNEDIDPFVIQTARDYCLDYFTVKDLFDKYYEAGTFYFELEKQILVNGGSI